MILIERPLVVALLLLMTGVVFLLLGILTVKSDPKNQARRTYLFTTSMLALWSVSFGLMTIAHMPESTFIFWAAGLLGTFLFIPSWLMFLVQLTKCPRFNGRVWVVCLYLVCVFFWLACVTSGGAKFVETVWGNQFLYENATFSLAFYIISILLAGSVLLEISLYRKARLKRQKIQSLILIGVTLLLAPPATFVEWIAPRFAAHPMVPLGSVLTLLAAMVFAYILHINKGLDVTVNNAAASAFKSVTLPVLLLDHENKVVAVNLSAEKLWGVSKEELEGTFAGKLIEVEGKHPKYPFFDLDISKIPVRVGTQAGMCRCELSLNVVRDRYGDALYKICVLEDLTALFSALQQAEEASRAKGSFLSRMSHEIRTPLNAIIGMTHIAQRSIDNPEKAMEFISGAITASEHLLGIINDVLDMSKIEMGKFEIAKEPFRLVPALYEVTSIFTQRCTEKQVAFRHNNHDLPSLWLVGDKLRLNQILINLLGNAVKFTDPGGIVSMAVTVQMIEEYAEVSFELTDTGIGMPEEFLVRMFDPFEQADATTAIRFGGTGLGLAISQNLVNMMGGQIEVESELGKGSVFRFSLRFPHAEIAEDAEQEDPQKVLDLRGKRILLVEDVEVNRVILRELLAETGAQIEEAEDGKRALDMFCSAAERYYDLIFMDVQMPHMNGYEATQAIRGFMRKDASEIPIIAMTANAYHEDVCKALEAGMNAHLAKPINIEMLMKTLANYLCS